jgi:hypothetical protein
MDKVDDSSGTGKLISMLMGGAGPVAIPEEEFLTPVFGCILTKRF